LSQNYSCAARNAKKETPVQMRSQACPAPTPRSERQQK